MAFDLLNNNLSGLAVIDAPAGALATNDNFIELYDYDFVFTATNDDGSAGFGATDEADVLVDYANSWDKGTENFTKSHRWNPTMKANYSQIVKSLYERSVSDTIHKVWVNTPEGPKWTSFEIARERDLHKNKIDLAQMTWNRRANGTAKGSISIFDQIKQDGNIVNDIVDDVEQLSTIALRIKQQNPNVKEIAVYHNHAQGAGLRQAVAGANAHYLNGTSYGMFNNNKNMALHLNFKSVYIDGITFHFMPCNYFDDPTLSPAYGNTNAVYVPMGVQRIKTDKAGEVSVPHLMYGYRSPSRKCEVKIFGPGGTPQVKDAKSVHFTTEQLNAVTGVNSFFLGVSDGAMGALT